MSYFARKFTVKWHTKAFHLVLDLLLAIPIAYVLLKAFDRDLVSTLALGIIFYPLSWSFVTCIDMLLTDW